MNTDDDDKEDIVLSTCANCGKEGSNLKSCAACKLVKYCSRDCQQANRPQHKRECKKRAAELHDEKLFKQPPLEFEDCPICFERMPTMKSGWRYKACCGKTICSGCVYAPVFDNQGNIVKRNCPFCRTPNALSDKESMGRLRKRVEANDPFAMHNVGFDYSEGTCGYPQDYTKALESWHRAAELGCANAYISIGCAYEHGGVEVDLKKANYYWELGAMKGDVRARYNLGVDEACEGNFDRSLKHHIIAVRGGFTKSLERIKWLYSNGYATKEDYMKALRAYQSYLGEIKSPQRDKAAAANETLYRYY